MLLDYSDQSIDQNKFFKTDLAIITIPVAEGDFIFTEKIIPICLPDDTRHTHHTMLLNKMNKLTITGNLQYPYIQHK